MNDGRILEGDNRHWLRRLIDAGGLVDAVVTDPPYGLTSIVQRFGKQNSSPQQFGTDGAFQRASRGFMGNQWDASGIERDPEFWRLVYDVLKPGSYVAAFSSPRTGHRQACAMEDAGFVMHPFLSWIYGQGMPKAHNAAKAIDKMLGVKGETIPNGAPKKRLVPGSQQNATGIWEKTGDRVYQPGEYAPASVEAEEWLGWGYGAAAMKPAMEPIYIGQKPFSEPSGAANLLKHGVGAMNLKACRTPEGRHPANVLHDGSQGVLDLFPQTSSGPAATSTKGTNDGVCYGAESRPPGTVMIGYGDTGNASRFFNCFPPDADCLHYHGKAGADDRAGSRHPTVKPQGLMRWLCRIITPPGGTVLDPFGGSGSTAQAARDEGFGWVIMEAEPTFCRDIERRMGQRAEQFSSDNTTSRN